ncbi:MAG: hypothetical protein CMO31_05190 [Trueperaceae bacterium]|nr:hypothetical protein [Trueperaceae bacterium]
MVLGDLFFVKQGLSHLFLLGGGNIVEFVFSISSINGQNIKASSTKGLTVALGSNSIQVSGPGTEMQYVKYGSKY